MIGFLARRRQASVRTPKLCSVRCGVSHYSSLLLLVVFSCLSSRIYVLVHVHVPVYVVVRLLSQSGEDEDLITRSKFPYLHLFIWRVMTRDRGNCACSAECIPNRMKSAHRDRRAVGGIRIRLPFCSFLLKQVCFSPNRASPFVLPLYRPCQRRVRSSGLRNHSGISIGSVLPTV